VIVREATPDDGEAVETVRVRGWQAAYRHVFPPEQLDKLPIDGTRWRATFARPPRGWTTLIAEQDGAVIGFVSVGPSRDEEGVGELYAIYVHPDAWSTGAGRALIEPAEERLRAEYEEATLWVLDDNPRARRFYEREGWNLDGARKTEERLGVRTVEVRYRKRLR
jgi:ribosomal protein S18 acetylase RimI-like enzyme